MLSLFIYEKRAYSIQERSERRIMDYFEEYLSQESSASASSSHYDEHTDRWVDEGSVSVYGHSGHCDVHTDEA